MSSILFDPGARLLCWALGSKSLRIPKVWVLCWSRQTTYDFYLKLI